VLSTQNVKNPVRIFFSEGGGGVGGYTAADDELTRTPLEPSNPPTALYPHCGNGDKMAEHLLLMCLKWAAERQRYFGDSIDITDVFQDYESLVEFLISLGHLSPHIGST